MTHTPGPCACTAEPVALNKMVTVYPIRFCPMHVQAPAMLALARAVAGQYEQQQRDPITSHTCSPRISHELGQQARAILRAVDVEEVR